MNAPRFTTLIFQKSSEMNARRLTRQSQQASRTLQGAQGWKDTQQKIDYRAILSEANLKSAWF
jgi:hypothetical protein